MLEKIIRGNRLVSKIAAGTLAGFMLLSTPNFAYAQAKPTKQSAQQKKEYPIKTLRAQIGDGEFFTLKDGEKVLVPYDKDLYIQMQLKEVPIGGRKQVIRTEMLLQRKTDKGFEYVTDKDGERIVIIGRFNPEDYGFGPGAEGVLQTTLELPNKLFSTVETPFKQGPMPATPVVVVEKPAPAVPQPITHEDNRQTSVMFNFNVQQPAEKDDCEDCKARIGIGGYYNKNKLKGIDATLFHKRVGKEKKWSIDLGGWYATNGEQDASIRVQDDERTIQGERLKFTTDTHNVYKLREYGILGRLLLGRSRSVNGGLELGIGQQKASVDQSYEAKTTKVSDGVVLKKYECNLGHEDLDSIIGRIGGVVSIPIICDRLRIGGTAGVTIGNIETLRDPSTERAMKIGDKVSYYGTGFIQIGF